MSSYDITYVPFCIKKGPDTLISPASSPFVLAKLVDASFNLALGAIIKKQRELTERKAGEGVPFSSGMERASAMGTLTREPFAIASSFPV